MQLALFLIFGVVAVAAAVNLLLQRHPIHSALSLVVVMVSLAALYWSLGAEFLAAAQIIVYAGAVMVLFLFVVMLLNAGEEARTNGSRMATLAGVPGVVLVLAILFRVFYAQRGVLGAAGGTGLQTGAASNLHQLSTELFTTQLLPFEVTSVLILIAILGAVVLARKEL